MDADVLMSSETTNVYQIQMFRNARTDNSQKIGGSECSIHSGVLSGCEKASVDFFLFDYYDCLRFVIPDKDHPLVYRDIIADPNSERSLTRYSDQTHPTSTTNIVTVVDIREGCVSDNPFLDAPGHDPYQYSDTPFLALITLTIKSSFFSKSIEEFDWRKPCNVDKVLKELLTLVEDKARACVSGHARVHAYLAANTGDMVIAARLSTASDAYKIAFFFRAVAPFKDGKYPELSFNTFTALSMEMRSNVSGLSYLEWSADSSQKNPYDPIIVLRMRMDRKTMIELQKASKKIHYDMVRPVGLFGHYDMTTRLSFQQFQWLYPYLCAYKFIPKMSDEARTYAEMKIDEDEQPCLGEFIEFIKKIARGLITRTIQLSNERCCAWPNEWNEDTKPEDQVDCSYGIEAWRAGIGEMKGRLDALRGKAPQLMLGRKLYLENMRMMSDILTAYSAVGDQIESACSGVDFLKVMTALIYSIEGYWVHIELLQREARLRPELANMLYRACAELNAQFSRSVDDVSIHFKLIYLNNLQTIQMHQYEIDARVDSRKFILAYMEFAHLVVDNHMHFMNARMGEKRPVSDLGYARIMPIICIDHMSDLRAFALFRELSNFWRRPYTNQIRESSKLGLTSDLLVSISTPSFESIVHMFDVLPSLIHEVAHFRRVLPQRERNHFVIEMVCRKVADFIGKAFIEYANKHTVYVPQRNVQMLVADSFYGAIRDACDDRNWLDMSFQDMFDALRDFFLEYFMFQEDYTANGDSAKCVRDVIAAIAHFPMLPSRYNPDVVEGAPDDVCAKVAVNLLSALDSEDSIELDDRTWEYIDQTCKTLVPDLEVRVQDGAAGLVYEKLREVREIASKRKDKLLLKQLFAMLYATSGQTDGDLPWLSGVREALRKTGRVITTRRSIAVPLFSKIHAPIDLVQETSPQQYLGPIYTLIQSAIQGIFYQMAVNLKRLLLVDIIPVGGRGWTAEFSGYKKSIEKIIPQGAQRIDALKKVDEINALLFSLEGNESFTLLDLAADISSNNTNFESHWLWLHEELNTRIESLARLFKKSAMQGNSGKASTMELSARFIKDEADHALQLAMDLHCHQMALHRATRENYGEIDLFQSWHRDQIGHGAHERMCARLLEHESEAKKWLALTSNYVNALINPLAVMTKDKEQFDALFRQSLFTRGRTALSGIIATCKEYYAEAGSDLFMCACMGFSSFAYLKVFEERHFNARYYARAAEEIKINREQLVLGVLLLEERAACRPVLDDDCAIITCDAIGSGHCERCKARKCYIDATPLTEQLKQYGQKLTSTIINESLRIISAKQYSIDGSEGTNYIIRLREFFESQLETILNPEKYMRNGFKGIQDDQWRAIAGGIASMEGPARELRGIIGCWDSFQYMRESFYEKGLTVPLKTIDGQKWCLFIDTPDLSHFKGYFDNFLKEAGNRLFDLENAVEPSCAKVAKWYENGISYQNKDFEENARLKETLIFMLRYYYLHQFRIHSEGALGSKCVSKMGG